MFVRCRAGAQRVCSPAREATRAICATASSGSLPELLGAVHRAGRRGSVRTRARRAPASPSRRSSARASPAGRQLRDARAPARARGPLARRAHRARRGRRARSVRGPRAGGAPRRADGRRGDRQARKGCSRCSGPPRSRSTALAERARRRARQRQRARPGRARRARSAGCAPPRGRRASGACARSCWTSRAPSTRRRWPAPWSPFARRSTGSSCARPRYPSSRARPRAPFARRARRARGGDRPAGALARDDARAGRGWAPTLRGRRPRRGARAARAPQPARRARPRSAASCPLRSPWSRAVSPEPPDAPDASSRGARSRRRPARPASSGSATALPERRVPNAEIAARARRRAPSGSSGAPASASAATRRPDSALSDLAASAGRSRARRRGPRRGRARPGARRHAAADEITPSAAPLVAHALGRAQRRRRSTSARPAPARSPALAHATAWIEAGRARHVLVIGAEILTRLVDSDDRRTAPLFGDGAGAIVVSLDADGQIGPFVLGSDGARPRRDPRHARAGACWRWKATRPSCRPSIGCQHATARGPRAGRAGARGRRPVRLPPGQLAHPRARWPSGSGCRARGSSTASPSSATPARRACRWRSARRAAAERCGPARASCSARSARASAGAPPS